MFEALGKIQETKKITWLIPLVTGLIGVSVGVTLMYVLPAYVISILNTTGLFNTSMVNTAYTQVQTIQAIGFLVVVISLIWLVIGMISAGTGEKK